MEDGLKAVEPIGDGSGADHPLKGGVVMAEGIKGGRVVEDVEIKVGEFGVVVEVVLKESEELVWGEGWFEVG